MDVDMSIYQATKSDKNYINFRMDKLKLTQGLTHCSILVIIHVDRPLTY